MPKFVFNPLTSSFDLIEPPVDISGKQDTLVSGTNIKTINSTSILGSGDLTISGGSSTTVDTKANILASTATSGLIAFATDTREFFLADGTNWNVASVKMSTELSGQDMGYTQDNDKQGYGEDYIDGKKATTFGIGQFVGTPYNGALRLDQSVTPMKMQIFARGIWNQIFYDLQMVNGDFEHIPVAYTIDVRSGNSNQVGLNGLPIVREYKVDMGAYPTRIIIDGGTL